MQQLPSYWRLDIYEQTATVRVEDGFAEIELHISIGEETVIYQGDIAAIASSLPAHIQSTMSGNILKLTTLGIPFCIDSPTLGVQIAVDIEEDFVLAFAPTVAQHKIVYAYHQALMSAIAGESLYPATNDWHLYLNYKPYYQAVMKRLLPDFDSDRWLFSSRHEFLVSTEPIQHPKTKQWMSGTPGLTQLMGFTVSGIEESEEPSEVEEDADKPKDDTVLSAITGALLIFKGRAGWVTQNFSLVELSYLLSTASERIRAANAEMENKFKNNDSPRASVPEVRPAPESDRWKEVKEGAIAQLSEMNIPMPKNF